MNIRIKNRNHLFWILQIAGWTVFSIFFFLIVQRRSESFLLGIYLFFITYVAGVIISTGLRHVYRRVYKRLKSIPVLALYIVLFSMLAMLLWKPLDVLLSAPFWEEGALTEWLKTYENFHFLYYLKDHLTDFVIFCLWSTLYFGIKFWLDWQAQIDKVEKANALAQEAKLQMLRYQLNPHFLFNSLNSIKALVDEDGKVAKSMITELSEFLRYSLINENDSFKPLQNEMEAIKHYFSIEKKRFEEKLEISYDIEKEAESYRVLSFLIQPFVENAIKYGMQTSRMPLKIKIEAKVTNKRLILNIKNSGHWIDNIKRDYTTKHWEGTGKGLENVKMRLENAYPENHKLEFEKAENYVMAILEIYDPN